MSRAALVVWPAVVAAGVQPQQAVDPRSVVGRIDRVIPRALGQREAIPHTLGPLVGHRRVGVRRVEPWIVGRRAAIPL